MSTNLHKSIQKIEQTISSFPEIITCLQKIRKYTEYESETATLLGKFIKTKIGSQLPDDAKNKLIKAIKSNNLEDYFYLKEPAPKNRMGITALILLIAGLPMIYVGGIQLLKGNISGALGGYPIKAGRGGGIPGILGFVMMIAAGIRYSYEIRKKKFIADLDKNSAP